MIKTFTNNIAEIVSALFIILFIYTATDKMLNRAEFESILWQNTLIGHHAPLLSWTVPVIEFIIAAMLATPPLNRAGLWVATITMGLFIIYIIAMKVLLPVMPCYCGGFIKSLTWNQHLVFNSSFMLLGVIAIKHYTSTGRPTPSRQHISLQ